MRVFIFGVDGLEYNFIKSHYTFVALRQKESGRVYVHPSMYHASENMPLTPVVWASLITGKLPSEHGITSLSCVKWDNKLIDYLAKLTRRVGLWRFKAKGRLAKKLGFTNRYISKDDYKTTTIFDLTPNYIQLNVPSFDPTWDFTIPNRPVKQLELFFRERFEKRKKQLIQTLRKTKNWELFMCYFAILDSMGHFYWGNEKVMFHLYSEIEFLFRKVKKLLPEKTAILVLSDHGMQRDYETKTGGIHSGHAFYSCNLRLGLENPEITDFYGVIKRLLGD